jgi:hypothetical protein
MITNKKKEKEKFFIFSFLSVLIAKTLLIKTRRKTSIKITNASIIFFHSNPFCHSPSKRGRKKVTLLKVIFAPIFILYSISKEIEDIHPR